ncbi:DUF4760 domain-containing protein [Jeotgalibacillus haloalkalitolerans]|uniref:DUF4760 domain-containing protein n=1 Tax=Jeotgalibacillus haloalkalitolerans TaxID=3104292 RepID=UPI002ACC26FC|nr:hypothetical protein [Jeotgalibacillus sp. HH7-29]
MSVLVGFAAIASGLSGILMSLSSRRGAVFEAIREYYQQGDTSEMIAARRKIYSIEEKETVTYLENSREWTEEQSLAAAELCSFFHFWGMMVRKGYLPLWIFKSASGPSIVRLHYLLNDFIKQRRIENNTYYAQDFEYLAEQIKRKYKIYYPIRRRGRKR